MSKTGPQTRLLIFLLCWGILLSLAQATLLQGAASHDQNGILGRGMAGPPKRSPRWRNCKSVAPTRGRRFRDPGLPQA